MIARAGAALLAVWATAATAAQPSAPEDPASARSAAPAAQDQFEALVREIDALRTDLDKLDRHERTIVNEMDRLAVESALHAREVGRLSALGQSAAAELAQTRLRLEARRADLAREESALASQLRSAYQMGRAREVRLVLSLTEPVDVMRAIAYIDVMAARQSGVVRALARGRLETEALERSLRAQTEGLDDLVRRERGRAAELEAVRRRAAALLQTTRQDRDAHRRAIAELTRAATDLESAIVSSAEAGPGPAAPPAVDVGELRGALEWPVPGEVAVAFGDIRDSKFGTVTPHPGVDIRTEPRAPIRAILPGRVVFARRFAGYGNTVLVDHGGHYLTVYARAAVVNVSEGEPVAPGQIIGVAADQAFDDERPTVYFELRHDGRAIDPAPWLKRKAASRREDGR